MSECEFLQESRFCKRHLVLEKSQHSYKAGAQHSSLQQVSARACACRAGRVVGGVEVESEREAGDEMALDGDEVDEVALTHARPFPS